MKNQGKVRILKSGIMLIFLLSWMATTMQAQETIINTHMIDRQADKDWRGLGDAMRSLGVGYQKAVDSGYLEMRRYEDKIYKNRSKLAKAFWNSYPEDPRCDNALYLFFNAYAEPHFLPDTISDSLMKLMENISSRDMRITRLKPVDHIAMKAWRQAGDSMVASVLNSNASIERKEAAELQLIAREFRQAIKLGNALPKEKSESEYWNRLEIQYYQHIRLLLEDHVNKYASLEIVAARVKIILNLLKNFSSVASDAYWYYFYKMTGSDNLQANQPGIKALHKLAGKNVAEIEALNEVDFTKPLKMAFIAMNGTKVDISELRGKVVLIDFWATYCGPCIKEMPHVRALYDKYRNQGLEVIGIAADGDDAKERVIDILEKKGATWPQRLDEGLDASVSYHALYKITALPTVWLLNKDGVIVDRNARSERLEPLIRKYLGLEK